MAATGEWELVKNSRKKGSSVPNGKLSKEEKKSFIDKAPRVTATGMKSDVVLEITLLICGPSFPGSNIYRRVKNVFWPFCHHSLTVEMMLGTELCHDLEIIKYDVFLSNGKGHQVHSSWNRYRGQGGGFGCWQGWQNCMLIHGFMSLHLLSRIKAKKVMTLANDIYVARLPSSSMPGLLGHHSLVNT